MSNYQRIYAAGATYFFTVNLEDRTGRLLIDYVDALRRAFAATRDVHPFHIDAVVILPDHLHCIWSLPSGDSDFSTRWRLIKARFSHVIPTRHAVPSSKAAKCERGVWQRRFWEHLIRNDKDYAAHIEYIHYNPVKHCHVDRVVDWPYSSFHRFVRDGVCPADWAGSPGVDGRY